MPVPYPTRYLTLKDLLATGFCKILELPYPWALISSYFAPTDKLIQVFSRFPDANQPFKRLDVWGPFR
jgi:hypothetical protein